ncbi:peptidoglycan editing factor PgeF [Allohahella marinimesophila]|uniref:Purine nucleoside phosphorylase n=1 Tax=Allohahella marinimesophila TaxID=1054972 RepID=A0ABP7PTB9_9GAMM
MVEPLEVMAADWSAPHGVHAFTTWRAGGVSLPPYNSLNLGTHVGDDPEAVAENRRRLWSEIQRQSPTMIDVTWLTQVHGTRVAEPGPDLAEADALFTRSKGRALAVMTADCLPVFLTAADGSEIAVAHAGWRGLADGVIEAAVERFANKPASILAHLGPAIGPTAFEVGEDVRAAFIARDSRHAGAFQRAPKRDDRKYWCNIYLLASQILQSNGVTTVTGGKGCTYTQPDRYFSYRRNGPTGRMASIIWLD